MTLIAVPEPRLTEMNTLFNNKGWHFTKSLSAYNYVAAISDLLSDSGRIGGATLATGIGISGYRSYHYVGNRFRRINPILEDFKLWPKPGESIQVFQTQTVDEVVASLDGYYNHSSQYIMSFDNMRIDNPEYNEYNIKTGKSKVAKTVSRLVPTDTSLQTPQEFTNKNFGIDLIADEATDGTESRLTGILSCEVSLACNKDGTFSLIVDTKGNYPLTLSNKKSTSTFGYNDITVKLVSVVLSAMQSNKRLKGHRGRDWLISDVIVTNIPNGLFERFTNSYTDKHGKNRLGVTRSSSMPTMLFTSADTKNYDQWHTDIRQMDEARFIREWAEQSLKTEEANLAKLRKRLEEIKTDLMQCSRDVGDKARSVSIMKQGSFDFFTQTINTLKQLPSVEAVEFEDGSLVIRTGDVWYKSRDNAIGTRYLGRYLIRIGIATNYASFVNLAAPSKDYPHPHAGATSMCMGQYPNMIASALEAGDYELALSCIISMLSDVTESDGGAYDAVSDDFSRTKIVGVKSNEIAIFGAVPKRAVITSVDEPRVVPDFTAILSGSSTPAFPVDDEDEDEYAGDDSDEDDDDEDEDDDPEDDDDD